MQKVSCHHSALVCLAGLLFTLEAHGAEWIQHAGFRSMPATIAPSGKRAGFTLLSNVASGIHFTNALSDRLLAENYNFMQGSGVALGDFDGDGRCDIYLCAIDGTNRLYRNLGDWKFEDVTTKANVGCADWHSTGACFADLNGDGKLDLLVSTLGKGVHSFLGDGQGGFRESTSEAGLISDTGSMTLALADVDGDGDLDLYVANYGAMAILRSSSGRAAVKRDGDKLIITGPYAKRLRHVNGQLEEIGEPHVLYLNDGAGHFKAAPWNSEFFLDENGKPMAEPWDFGLGAQMRDINGDGFPDIYVCNDFKTPDRVWLNDGSGHFRLLPKLAMRHQSYSSMGVDFADIDRDGRLDIFVVEMLSRDHPRRIRSLSENEMTPLPGRFDDRPQLNRNTLFWNRGDGAYAEIACFNGLEASEWSWQPVFIDVDLDGFEDLLVVNGNARDVLDRDTIERVRTLGRQTPDQSRSNIFRFPKLEIANVAFRNRGDLTFEEAGQSWGFSATNISQGIALADLDGDGDLDVVVNCLNAPPLIYRNDSTATRVAVRLRGKSPNIQGIGAKISVAAKSFPVQSQEIVSGGRYLSADDPMRVFAAIDASNVEVTWRSGLRSVLTNAQPNHIYEIDEAFAEQAPVHDKKPVFTPLFTDVSAKLNHTHFESAFEDFTQQPLLPRRLSQSGPAIAWIDLDGDGRDELIIGAGRGGRLAAFRGDGHGSFRNVIPTNAPALPDDITAFAGWSLPGERPSLLTAFARFENPALKSPVIELEWNKNVDQVAAAPMQDVNALEGSTGPIAVADIDGNGVLDVFVGGSVVPGHYPKAGPARIFRQENGALLLDQVNTALLRGIGLVNAAIWTDLNGDGFPELVVACEWGPIRVFKSERGRLHEATSEIGVPELTGWWQGICAGDFNGDGRMDLIVANWGLNDSYKPAPSYPLRLHYGSRGELLETYYSPERDAYVPRRGLSALTQVFPALAEAFPTHTAFGAATSEQILKVISLPEKLEASTLSTTLLLNRGDYFEIQPLPAEAQFAPAFSVNVADLDGDGNEDIFLSQNFFATRPDSPRFDGGRSLVLRGDGKGGFSAMSSELSGIAADGEQRGACLGDFDGDGRVDLALTQNGAQTLLYHNSTAKPGLRVRLEGPPGNPSGFGAIVRLEFESGLGPARELHAGSGYRSQDSATLVLATPTAPKAIHVLWPGGAKRRTELPPGAKEVTVLRTGTLAPAAQSGKLPP